MFITEVLANGNGRQVMWPRLQSELRKRNTLCVFITEASANENGRWKWRTGYMAPLQSELWKRNALCVHDRSAIEWEWQTGHVALP